MGKDPRDVLNWDVPPFWSVNMARVLDARTGRLAQVLARLGLPPDLVDAPPARLAIGAEIALLEAAVEEIGDATAAAEIGLAFDPRRTSLLSYLLLNARRLEDGIALAQRFVRIERRRAVFTSRTEGDDLLLIVDVAATGVRDNPLYIEHALGAVLAVLRCAVGHQIAPRQVLLGHRRVPEVEARLAQLFGAAVFSGAQGPALVFDRSVLGLPLADPDTVLLPHLAAHAQTLLDGLPQHDGELAFRVQAEIAGLLPRGVPTKQAVADRLGLSPRTLSRRLSEEGTGFETLLTDLRRDMADRYLRDRQLGLAQIAHLLGYSDQAAFTAAYRRWTGTTPGAARPRGRDWRRPRTE